MGNRALANALGVLLCFDARRPEWRVTDLARETGLDKSHVVKILNEFVEARLILQDAVTRRYRVGPRALAVGAGYATAFPLARQAGAAMRSLSGRTGYTVTLNALDGDDVLHFMSVEGAQAMPGNWPVGTHIPWHATAAGKVHAAFLPAPNFERLFERPELPSFTPATIRDPRRFRGQIEEIRRRGYAVTLGESTPGLGAMAMPVFGPTDRFLGAVSLLFPIGRVAHMERPPLVAALCETATGLSRKSGAERYPYRVADLEIRLP